MVTCPNCESDELDLIEKDSDDRRHIRCVQCGHDWWRGEAKRAPQPRTINDHRAAFEAAHQLAPGRKAVVDGLKAEFLTRRPGADDDVVEYWTRYQQIFSRDGLPRCNPRDLKDFANTETGARPGNMSVFNTAWNELGDEEAARRTRSTIEYLLYGPDTTPLEDRLTNLIEGRHADEMRGFKESLLTKVLCIVQPERFLPILIYSSEAGGKRQIANLVFGLSLPPQDRAQRPIGRLITWSNDLLVEHAGTGFESLQHMSDFLWWAKYEVREGPVPRGVTNHTGKYRELWRWLTSRREDEVRTTFAEIEAVLREPLPPSSRAHVPHWHGYEGSAVARAIADAGWRASDVNLTAETVTFVRTT